MPAFRPRFTTLSSTKARLGGVFYGWWVLGGCLVAQLLSASFTVHAFGAYVAVMQADFGWSRTAFAAAFSIQQAGSGLLGPFQGLLIGRFGARSVIRVGLVLFALALVLLSRVQSLTGFYAVYVLLAVGASFAGFLSLNAVVAQWFERRRSIAFALMQVGISLGGLLVPLVAWALESFGWRSTAFATGLLTLLVGLPVTLLIGNRPEDYGLEPDGRAAGTAPSAKVLRRSFTAAEALRTRVFWLISVGHGLALMVVFAVTTHLVLALQGDKGFTLQMAAAVVSLMTAVSIVGQLTGGVLGDRLDKRLVAAGAMIGHAGALFILAHGSSPAWVIAFAVIHGFSWGLRGPLMQALRADYFGRIHFAQILGFSNVVVTVGTILGPLLAGVLADRSGSYAPGFTVLAGVALLGAFCFFFATPPEDAQPTPGPTSAPASQRTGKRSSPRKPGSIR